MGLERYAILISAVMAVTPRVPSVMLKVKFPTIADF
jgi:hypothetical protein